jgi:hypothetical protein
MQWEGKILRTWSLWKEFLTNKKDASASHLITAQNGYRLTSFQATRGIQNWNSQVVKGMISSVGAVCITSVSGSILVSLATFAAKTAGPYLCRSRMIVWRVLKLTSPTNQSSTSCAICFRDRWLMDVPVQPYKKIQRALRKSLFWL